MLILGLLSLHHPPKVVRRMTLPEVRGCLRAIWYQQGLEDRRQEGLFNGLAQCMPRI